MIIRQTTTIIFEYPQDYLQEQEWCKTKGDRWIHKSTDTLGAVYENTILYSISQPSSSEKPNNCEEWQDWKDRMWAEAVVTEPQTDTEIAKTIVHKMIDDAVIAEDAYPDLRQKLHDAVDNYEPQTERSE